MEYTRKEYEKFLTTELDYQKKEYEQIVNTRAMVLKSRGEVFVGKFQHVQESGIVVFKVRNSEFMPRKNSFWTACIFIGDKGSFKNWGENSWAHLRANDQKDFSDAFCVWVSKADDPEFCLIGIKNLTLSFVKILEESKPIVAFGPKDPPLQYLTNLIDLVRTNDCPSVNQLLDFERSNSNWSPKVISKDDNLNDELLDLFQHDCKSVVIQGPPGTGKTYRMAQLAATLLSQGKSVLVTALTNQALMELAKKDDLKEFLSLGKVAKTSLTIDEHKELPNLEQIIDNKCNATPGCLSLASFYVASGWAIDSDIESFDYVLMDEASQALFPMIAATKKLSDKVIWIGDQCQLPPIVIMNDDIVNDHHWNSMIGGFQTVCSQFNFNSFILSDTFRLMKRGADCTGVFYGGILNSVSKYESVPSSLEFVNTDGGPVLIEQQMKIGDKSPSEAIHRVCNMVKSLFKDNAKSRVAVLAKFRETVREIQKVFVINWETNSLPETLKIETVDRVQGLTVDYCFFVIPNASVKYSLNDNLFNVATSRALYNTFIIADNLLLKESMSDSVRRYLLKSQENSMVRFSSESPKRIEAGDIGVTVLGHIDVSKFGKEKPTVAITGKHVFVIDTNVFVNCPDIISRIGRESDVIVPAKVLEELDKLKLKPSVDKSALSAASKNICNAFTKNFSRMEEADVSLLPKGFDDRNPDCMILSVALKHKDENPILLSSDNIMLTRAAGLGVKAMSLKDFIKK